MTCDEGISHSHTWDLGEDEDGSFFSGDSFEVDFGDEEEDFFDLFAISMGFGMVILNEYETRVLNEIEKILSLVVFLF